MRSINHRAIPVALAVASGLATCGLLYTFLSGQPGKATVSLEPQVSPTAGPSGWGDRLGSSVSAGEVEREGAIVIEGIPSVTGSAERLLHHPEPARAVVGPCVATGRDDRRLD